MAGSSSCSRRRVVSSGAQSNPIVPTMVHGTGVFHLRIGEMVAIWLSPVQTSTRSTLASLGCRGCAGWPAPAGGPCGGAPLATRREPVVSWLDGVGGAIATWIEPTRGRVCSSTSAGAARRSDGTVDVPSTSWALAPTTFGEPVAVSDGDQRGDPGAWERWAERFDQRYRRVRATRQDFPFMRLTHQAARWAAPRSPPRRAMQR